MSRRKLKITLLLLASLGTVNWVLAQSGSRSYAPAQSGSRSVRPQQAELPYEERLWEFLSRAQYRNWAPLPGQTDEAYAGHSPHGEQVKLYANRVAAGRSSELPTGSILIKENFDATGTELMAITVMYRSTGYAPESGDWYWAKYEPSGAVSTMNNMRVGGRVNMCIDCHTSAGGGDFVFANDSQ